MKILSHFFIVVVLLFTLNVKAQDIATIRGVVLTNNEVQKPIPDVQIFINGIFKGDFTSSSGTFSLTVPANTPITLLFTFLSVKHTVQLEPIAVGSKKEIRVIFPYSSFNLPEVNVKGQRERSVSSTHILEPRSFEQLPTLGAGIEALLKTMPGVSSGNELSAQYNVRGGSFDENLVYVNDFEIFRPQLVRTGQQEGLSFINPVLVKNLKFSAGGFEGKYGDKLSSVLDVEYQTPKKTEVGAQLSFMGAEMHLGSVSKNRRFSFIGGLRYRANNYVLNTLDVKGEYNPIFVDFQSLMIYNFNEYSRIEWFVNLAQNKFQLTPVSQRTSFGTVQQALLLDVAMAGNEILEYNSAMSGLSYIYEPHSELKLKFLVSGISANESERYDVYGAYRLDILDNNLGSDDFGQSVATLGNGFFINHARNNLYYNILTLDHKGFYKPIKKRYELQWGIGGRRDFIEDRFKEWKYNDSSDYNINPFKFSQDSIFVTEYINSQINLYNYRLQSFFQAKYSLKQAFNEQIIIGARSHFTSLNNQNVISPRVQYSIEPNKKHNDFVEHDSLKKKDYVLKMATGVYYQPPFYREMRDFDGSINQNLKAQRAVHFTVGSEYFLKLWNRPFVLFTEAYYKNLDYLVPYILDNMRIRYYADNSARGYAAGVDARINGEFVKGLESWFTLSFLKTDEKIMYLDAAGQETESPYLRRPTDRRVSASLMFQDELEKFPDFRFNLNLVFGAPLPYYLPGQARYAEGNRIPSYQRVDAGFNYMLLKEGDTEKTLSKYLKSAWVGLEVFNMLGINNVVSYLWVKDIQNNVYGVPNFLTARRINLRFVARL